MKRKFVVVSIVVLVMSLVASSVSAQEGRRGRLQDGIARELIMVITDATGLTGQEFIQAIRDGATPAEVITANGGDVEMVVSEAAASITLRINEAVAEGKITQVRADEVLANLETTLTAAVNGELNGFLRERLRERRGNKGEGRMPREVIEVIIAETGLTTPELREALETSTLPEVLAANGADVQVIVDRVMAFANERAANAVAADRITQEEANERLQNFEQRLTDFLTGAATEDVSSDMTLNI